MAVIRTLEHFTQNEVDKAATETLTKDLPYGGNRPYVIGTILRDPTNGEYILWSNGTEEHRLCIEHLPNEYVEWTIPTISSQSLTKRFGQMAGVNTLCAKVKRIGFIPLRSYAPSESSGVNKMLVCTRNDFYSSQLKNYTKSFFEMDYELSSLFLERDGWDAPQYREIDALPFVEYYTKNFCMRNMEMCTPCVVYYVYELSEMKFRMGDPVLDGGRAIYSMRIPFNTGSLAMVHALNINDLNEDLSIEVLKNGNVIDVNPASGSHGYDLNSVQGGIAYYMYAEPDSRFEFHYGESITVKLPLINSGAPVYLAFTN